MFELLHLNCKIDVSDFILIVPSVSIGNVGQLTIDLLISTHQLKKIGTLWHPGIIPSVGGDPYTSDEMEISTACELYANEDIKIVALQLRSSIEYKLALDFFHKLKEMISRLQFQKVIILTSSYSYELHDIQSSPFRYVSTNGSEILSELNIRPMESSESGEYSVPGSGFAIKLYQILKDSIACTVFIKYTSEGDNRPDALAMLELLHRCIDNFQLKKLERISFPSSWEHVFGNPPPTGLF